MGYTKYAEDIRDANEERGCAIGLSGEIYSYYSVTGSGAYRTDYKKPKTHTPTSIYSARVKLYRDGTIQCRVCGKSFQFTAQKQKEFDDRGWQLPKRCDCCRKKARENKQSSKDIGVCA